MEDVLPNLFSNYVILTMYSVNWWTSSGTTNSRPSLVQIMAGCLLELNTLSEPMMTYRWLDFDRVGYSIMQAHATSTDTKWVIIITVSRDDLHILSVVLKYFVSSKTLPDIGCQINFFMHFPEPIICISGKSQSFTDIGKSSYFPI